MTVEIHAQGFVALTSSIYHIGTCHKKTKEREFHTTPLHTQNIRHPHRNNMKIKVTSKTIVVGILPLIVGYANASKKANKSGVLPGEDDGAAVAATSKKTKSPADLLVLLEKKIAAGTIEKTELPADLLVLLEKQADIAATGTAEKTDALPADVPLDQDDGVEAFNLIPTPFPTDFPTDFPTTYFPTTYSPTTSSAPSPFCDDGMNVEVKIWTDIFPDETSWTLQRNEPEGVVVMSGGPYEEDFTRYRDEKCLPFGNYIFTIYDKYGDGLGYFYDYRFHQLGKYEVNVDGVTTLSGGEYAFKYETQLIWKTKPSGKAGKASSKANKSGGGYSLEGVHLDGLSMPSESLSM
jgi:hypothetical protein